MRNTFSKFVHLVFKLRTECSLCEPDKAMVEEEPIPTICILCFSMQCNISGAKETVGVFYGKSLLFSL